MGPLTNSLLLIAVAGVSEPTAGALSLEQAIQRTIKSNWQIKAQQNDLRAFEALSEFAAPIKNPRVGVTVEDFLGNGSLEGFNNGQATLTVRQTLQLGGKRDALSKTARSRLNVASASLNRTKSQVVGETAVRFFHVAADQHRLAIAETASRLAAQSLEFVTRRVSSGASSALEIRRAKITVARSKVVAEHAEHELRASKRRLAALWGDPKAEIETVTAHLFEHQSPPSYEELAQQIEQSPQFEELRKLKQIRLDKAQLARSNRVPDLDVGLGARRNQEMDAFALVLSVSAPLPIFDQKQGQFDAANHRADSYDNKLRELRARTLARLYEHVQELTHAGFELTTLNDEILPEAQQVLELATKGFKQGRFSQLELIDAQRTVIELEMERVHAAETMWTLSARIDALLGDTPVGGSHDE